MFEDQLRRTAVLVPCYNENLTIRKVVTDLKSALPGATVYVFDNNSSDDTGKLAAEAGATVIREKRQGKGHVVASMLWKIDADYYLMIDGDDTYPASAALELLQPVFQEKADMVVGQRLSVYSDRAFPRFHMLGNLLVRGTINLIFRSHLTDVMSGYRAFNRDVAEALAIVSTGFDVETEMTLQCLYQNFVILEIPVSYQERPEGSVSKLRTFHDGARVLLKIFGMFRAYKPLTFFGGMGLAFLSSAMITGFRMAPDPKFPGFGEKGIRALTGAGGFSIGVLLISIGVVLHTVNARILEMSHTLAKRISKHRSSRP